MIEQTLSDNLQSIFNFSQGIVFHNKSISSGKFKGPNNKRLFYVLSVSCKHSVDYLFFGVIWWNASSLISGCTHDLSTFAPQTSAVPLHASMRDTRWWHHFHIHKVLMIFTTFWQTIQTLWSICSIILPRKDIYHSSACGIAVLWQILPYASWLPPPAARHSMILL